MRRTYKLGVLFLFLILISATSQAMTYWNETPLFYDNFNNSNVLTNPNSIQSWTADTVAGGAEGAEYRSGGGSVKINITDSANITGVAFNWGMVFNITVNVTEGGALNGVYITDTGWGTDYISFELSNGGLNKIYSMAACGLDTKTSAVISAGKWREYSIVKQTNNSFYIYENGTLSVEKHGITCNYSRFKLGVVNGAANSWMNHLRVQKNTSAPGGAVASNHFNITALDAFNSTGLLIFSANVTNGTMNWSYSTTNGTIITDLYLNDTAVYNISFIADWYYNRTYLNTDVTSNLPGRLSFLYQIFSTSFSRNVTFAGNNYARNVTYSINLTCPSFDSTNLSVVFNGSTKSNSSLSCTNESMIVTGSYNGTNEGLYNINFTYNASKYNEAFGNVAFIWDITNPSGSANFTRTNGFNNFATNVTGVCTDNTFPNLNYTLKFNGATLQTQNRTNNTAISNSSLLAYGRNEVNLTCADPFGSSTFTDAETVYAVTLYLVDERENVGFNASNISSARVYFDDNSSYFDFKAANTNKTNFTGIGTEKLRFELGYASGDIITRYVDVSLFGGADVRVCANKEGVTHYEQLILSGTVRPVFLKSVFSNCVIAADYTRFAYQDTYLLKAYSIATMYYLYVYEEGAQVMLASVDGTVSTYMNLDTLEFAQNTYNFNAYGQGLGIEKITDTEVQISYMNTNANNVNASIVISDVSTGTTYLSTTSTTPNNFTIYFDWTTLSVSNESLFVIEVTTVDKDGNVNVIKQYLNTQGVRGMFTGAVGFVIALLLTVFGLTMTASRYSLGWFGIAVLIGAIAVLGLSVWTWYVLMLMAIEFILLIFCVLVFTHQNYITVA